MPTYEYRCKSCAHEFEYFQSMKDAPLRKCPECGKNTLERLIGTGGAVIFKGSGFYQTDYRNESYKKAAEADKPRSDSSDKQSSEASASARKSTDGTKTQAKTETQPEKAPSDSSGKAKDSSAAASSTSKSAKKTSK